MRRTVNLAFVGEGLYCSVDEASPLTLGKAPRDVRDPFVFGELRCPDGVSSDDVRTTASGLKLGLELLEVLSIVLGHLPEGDLEFTLVLLVDLLYELILSFFGNALPIGEDHVTWVLSFATSRSPEQCHSCEPHTTEPQEIPAAQRVLAEPRYSACDAPL